MPRKWHIDGENDHGLTKIGYEDGVYTFQDPHTGDLFHGDRDDGGNLTRLASSTSRPSTPPRREDYDTVLKRNLRAAANAKARTYQCPITGEIWVSHIVEDITGTRTNWSCEADVPSPAPTPVMPSPLHRPSSQRTTSSPAWSQGSAQPSPRTTASGESSTSRGIADRPNPRRYQSTPSRLPRLITQPSPRAPPSGQFSTSSGIAPQPSRPRPLPRDSIELSPQRHLPRFDGPGTPAPPPPPPPHRQHIQAGRTPDVRPRAQPAPAPSPRSPPTPHPLPPLPRASSQQTVTNNQQTVNVQVSGYGKPINDIPAPSATYYPGMDYYHHPNRVGGGQGQGNYPPPGPSQQHAAYFPAGPSYSSRPLPQPPRAAPQPATPSPPRPHRKRSLVKMFVDSLFKRGPPHH